MSDLRRRALAGGKTTSKRSASRIASGQSSKATSKATSRANSTPASRHATDDEGWDSDGSVWSFGSVTDDIDGLMHEAPVATSWQDELHEKVLRITDKNQKKLATTGLEEALAAYCRILQSTVLTSEEAEKHILGTGLVAGLTRSIRNGKTDRETLLACQALVLSIITDDRCATFGEFNGLLQRVITDHDNLAVKTGAIRALSTVTFFTDAGTEDVEAVMDFFHEIIENDGNSIGAGDDGMTVAAAIEEFGLLMTWLDDAEDITDRTSEAFVDQLESTEIDVQVAAGEVIALMYEMAHRPPDEEDSDEEFAPDDNGFIETNIASLTIDAAKPSIEKYTVYRNTPHLKQLLTELTRSSSKAISKKNRKTQHTTFANVLHTVENPLSGPNYSKALTLDGREQGARLEVKVGQKGVIRLNTWSKLFRWNALRRFLGPGILVHWEKNEMVFEALPLLMDTPTNYKERKKSKNDDNRQDREATRMGLSQF